MKPQNNSQLKPQINPQFKAKDRETTYVIIEQSPDGTETELQSISNPKAFSEQERFQALTKNYRKAFPEAQFTYQPHPKLGLHLVNTKTNAIIFIKQLG